jgi:hypothetical protein
MALHMGYRSHRVNLESSILSKEANETSRKSHAVALETNRVSLANSLNAAQMLLVRSFLVYLVSSAPCSHVADNANRDTHRNSHRLFQHPGTNLRIPTRRSMVPAMSSICLLGAESVHGCSSLLESSPLEAYNKMEGYTRWCNSWPLGSHQKTRGAD